MRLPHQENIPYQERKMETDFFCNYKKFTHPGSTFECNKHIQKDTKNISKGAQETFPKGHNKHLQIDTRNISKGTQEAFPS